jgi:hypothetical protein
LRKRATWFRDNTELVAVGNITTSALKGQVRKNGIQSSHVKQLIENIRDRGQLVPITVDENYVAVDGGHRLEAFKYLMHEEHDEHDEYDGEFDKIRVYRRSFSSSKEKEEYQVKSNEHLPSKTNTGEDYADLIVKKLQKGDFGNITWNNYHDDSTNFDSLTAEVKKHFSYVNMRGQTAQGYVRRAISSAPGSKFMNTMTDELVKMAGCSSKTKWNGSKPKQESNGWWLLTLAQATHIYPQLAGNSLNRKIKNDNINNTVIINCNKLDGMTGAKLDQWRKDRVADINKLNNAHQILKKKLIDEILFSPQKIEGTCKESGFFKVKKRSNPTGDFDADSIPTGGWG